jgi:hypothetical protein
MNGIVAYLQNYSRVETLEKLQTPTIFGLKNTNNVTMVTLEIDY